MGRLHHQGYEIFCHAVAAADEPEPEEEGKEEGFEAGFLEFVDAGLRAQRRHCHGEEEGVEGVDEIDNALGKQVERVEADDDKEKYGEPWYADLSLVAFVSVSHVFCHEEGDDEEHGNKHHDAYHFHDDGVVAHRRSHGVARSHDVCHFMDGASGEDAHLRGGQIEDAGSEEDGVEEHGERAEDDYRCHRDRCFVGFGLDGSIDTHHRRCAAYCAATRREQGDGAVHLQQFAQRDAQENGESYDDGVDDDGGQSHRDDVLKAEFETIEDDAEAQDALSGEGDARHPCVGELVAQAVGINHSEDDTHHERTEGKCFHPLHVADVKCGTGEECHEEHAVEHAAVFFRNFHILVFSRYFFTLCKYTEKQ
jgi:hypothetical protein